MRTNRSACVLALCLTFAVAAEVGALVPGGGPAKSDCYSVFEGVSAVPGKKRVECADGDASCDADSTAGQCTFTFNVCAFQSGLAGCTPQEVTAFVVNPKHAAQVRLPPVPVSAPTCAEDSSIVVPHKKPGKKAGKTKVVLKATAPTGKPKKDTDKLMLKCLPSGTTTSTTIPNPLCAPNPAGGPRQLDYTVAPTDTDLDTGFSGDSHNFPIISGSTISLCLTDCDASTDPICKASGPTGPGSLNGETLGPPLPLLAADVAVCVKNKFTVPAIQGTVNVQTGEYQSVVDGTSTPINLDSEVFSTAKSAVCPQCKGGRCDSGPNQNRPCEVEGTVRVVNSASRINELYTLSASCPPGPPSGSRTGVVQVTLPLTTGTDMRTGFCPQQSLHDACGTLGGTCITPCPDRPDEKGGINQYCCSAGDQPCFPTGPGTIGKMERTGTAVPPQPPWPSDQTYPKTADGAKVVAVFCIGDTGEPVVNTVAGLPGPGAVIFNGRHTWHGNQ